MTKNEYMKLESCLDQAIQKAKKSNELSYKRDCTETELLQSIDYMAYAVGINQVLVSIGFKHERMKVLQELLR